MSRNFSISFRRVCLPAVWRLGILLILPGPREGAAGFFSASGQQILDPGGSPFLMRGHALSGWLTPEAYILRLNAVHGRHLGSASDIQNRIAEILPSPAAADAFWAAYQSNVVTQADIATLGSLGFNAIRIPFNYRMLSPWDSPGTYREEGFQVLDTAIGWCKTNGLCVILDMHCLPGGQSHDAPADPEHTYWTYDLGIQNWLEKGVACLWESNQQYYASTGRTPESNRQRTIDLWRVIAERYRDEPAIFGYEVINEPVLPAATPVADLRDLYVRITQAIREVDTHHLVLIDGNYFGSSFDGLMPPWDDNLVFAFHKYWRPATQAEIQPYLDLAALHDVPMLMTEAGENSNPWFHEFTQLLESNGIGWCWWGFKKVDSISAAYSAPITPGYQYVISNFRDLPIDAELARLGLMELAASLATGQCTYRSGFFDSLIDPAYAGISQPFVQHDVPGLIRLADFDLGTQDVAYHDARYKNEENSVGGPWNNGWAYRNEGADLLGTSEASGFKVGFTEAGEWLNYTVHVVVHGSYELELRVASDWNGGALQLQLDGTNLTEIIPVPDTGGWETFQSVFRNGLMLPAGPHVLRLSILSGPFDMASMRLSLEDPDSDHDRLDDVWEMSQFGTLTNVPDGDVDEDGFSNYQEQEADTEPTNHASYLRVHDLTLASPLAVTFHSSTARLYTLEFADDLRGGVWSNVPGAVDQAGGGGLILTDPDDQPSFRNYRLRARRP